MLADLLGDGIVLEKRLIVHLKLLLLEGCRGDVTHQDLFIDGCCPLQGGCKLRLMWSLKLKVCGVRGGMSGSATAVHI